MCDFSGRLIAWMDGELAANEAAAVEQHVQACAECRDCVAAYEEVSRGFAACYQAGTQTTKATRKARKVPLWVPVAAAAAVVAAMLVLALLPPSALQVPAVPQAAAIAPAIERTAVNKTDVKPVTTVQHRRVAAHKKTPSANWALAQPAIRIAIPADAMFPPGAVPEGVSYIANVSLSADGSVQRVRLRP